MLKKKRLDPGQQHMSEMGEPENARKEIASTVELRL
jgi:hypothetical protein